MNLLSKLLAKRNIDKIEDLEPEEQATFQRWSAVLKGETLTLAQVKEFCRSQIDIIEDKISSKATLDSNTYLAPCLHVYLNLLKLLEAPEKERENLEQHLVQLINQ